MSAASTCSDNPITDPTSQEDDLREKVQSLYAQCAEEGAQGVGLENKAVVKWGYDTEFLTSCGLQEDSANLLFRAACGGGCPLRLPGPPPQSGETVVDLGCGAGHDLVLAARMVGPTGAVLGIDLTPGMLEAARRNIDLYNNDNNNNNNNNRDASAPEKNKCAPVDLQCASLERPGDIPENYADVCISNGVFNLTMDKLAAFRTAFSVLKPGGRFLLNDLCRVEMPKDTMLSGKKPGCEVAAEEETVQELTSQWSE